MAPVIYKYPLRRADEQTVDMPMGARVISVGIQNGTEIMVWAVVDPSRPRCPRRFWICPTGEELPLSMVSAKQFVGTAMIAGGMLVFHVFTTDA